MTGLLLLSGSQRRDSLNSRLLQDVARRVQDRCRIDTMDPTAVDLPLFNQDEEDHPSVLDRVAVLHRRIALSDGLVVASPEYNGQLTPYLVNLVTWISRRAHVDPACGNPFRGRPVLLCSASTGWSGGALGLVHARALFEYVGCAVMDAAICVPYAHEAWTTDGFAFDPVFDAAIDAAVDGLLEYLGTRHASRELEPA